MKSETAVLEDSDRRLLRALQRDASASQAELAELAGVSASQVSRKISRLRDDGVLRGVVGLLDPARAGLTVSAIIRVRLRDHGEANLKAFRTMLAGMPEATFCVMVTGEADYLMRLVARDLPHFQEIVQSKVLRCSAIAHVESSIVLEVLKDTTELPLT
jgi:DNA-binding Lrp family transcriptional regulator